MKKDIITDNMLKEEMGEYTNIIFSDGVWKGVVDNFKILSR